MCGRFNLRTTAAELTAMFQAAMNYEPPVRFNIAPTQATAVCVQNETGSREIVPMLWGLIPAWSKDKKIAASLINARAETVAEKPSFLTAFKRRRCLVPMSGFYEWLRSGKTKQPFHIHRHDDAPFAVAGIWESWHDVNTFAVITTAANRVMSPIHDRMPVIIAPELYSEWLDNRATPEFLQSLIEPHEWSGIECVEVSNVVNNARNDVPECIDLIN